MQNILVLPVTAGDLMMNASWLVMKTVVITILFNMNGIRFSLWKLKVHPPFWIDLSCRQ